MTLIEISKEYFKTFSNKDLNGLKGIFAEDVILRDWDIEAKGLEEVLKANAHIFANVTSIQVKPLKIYNDKNTVIAELEIDVNDGEELLLVTDVIEFDNDERICTIRAYKG